MASNKKYKDAYYPVRTVTDMKDLINSSAELYGVMPLISRKMFGRQIRSGYL